MDRYSCVSECRHRDSCCEYKGFSGQLLVFLLLAFHIGRIKGIISLEKHKEYLREISSIPEKMADFIKMLT